MCIYIYIHIHTHTHTCARARARVNVHPASDIGPVCHLAQTLIVITITNSITITITIITNITTITIVITIMGNLAVTACDGKDRRRQKTSQKDILRVKRSLALKWVS